MQDCADLLLRDSPARCAAVLLRLAGQRLASGHYADLPTEIPASQAEIAMLCNMSRRTCGRILKGFASRPFVTIGYKSLAVNDPARLRIAADGG